MVMPQPKDVHYTRDRVAKNLRMWGLPQMAEQAERELPESFDAGELFARAHRKGVDIDVLISRLGGSP